MNKFLFYFVTLILLSNFSFAQLSITLSQQSQCFVQGATVSAVVATAPPGATNFSWTTGTGISICISGNSIVVVSPTMAIYSFGCCGTYTINCAAYSSANVLLGTTSMTVNLACNTNFTAGSNPNVICTGGSSNLSASGSGTYSWSSGGVGATTIVTPTITTTYTVTGAFSTGCINTKTVSVSVFSPSFQVTPTSATVCSGNSTTLTASGAQSYTWYPLFFNLPSIIVNPTVNTIYTVSALSFSGNVACTSTKTVGVVISGSLSITGLVTPTAACPGDQVTLTSAGASTYTWSTLQQGALITVTVPAVSGQAGYTVVGSSGNCASIPLVLNVLVLPIPTLVVVPNGTSVCEGATVTLTASGAQSYAWNTLASVPTITIVAVNGTNYTVTGTGANGCTNTAGYNVLTNPLPSITVVSTKTLVCSTDIVTLTAMGAQSYTWNTNAIVPSITVSAVNGVYLVIGRDVNGCENSATYTLLVTPSPTITAISSKTSICQGDKITLTPGGGTSYTWSPVPGSGTFTLTPTTSTNYTLLGTKNGCSNVATVSVTVNKCTGFLELAAERLYEVYPNPGSRELTIETKELIVMTIRSISGQMLYRKELSEAINVIDISMLEAGYYFITLQSSQRIRNIKFIKE